MSAARSLTRPLDVRSLMVLDTRELGRRPGSMLAVSREVAAPQGWSLELVTISPGTPIRLELRLESVMEGVLVSGTASLDVTAECGRCLDPLHLTVTAPIQELFAYQPEPGDEEIPILVGDALDLEPVLRDAIVLALPLNPVCDENCPGLCSTCGEPLADLPAEHHHDDVDPRWAALSALTVNVTAETAEESKES